MKAATTEKAPRRLKVPQFPVLQSMLALQTATENATRVDDALRELTSRSSRQIPPGHAFQMLVSLERAVGTLEVARKRLRKLLRT